jgi:hypothetical protein
VIITVYFYCFFWMFCAGNNTTYTGINVTFLYFLYWYKSLNDLCQFSHVSQYASSHTIHHEIALLDFPYRSQELQSFSDLMIAFRFSNERTKRFPGNCLDHVSDFPPFSSNDTSWRHIGHLKPVDFSPFTDDVIYVWMHVSQNVWRYGRYFGTLNVSRHIVQVSRSSTVLSTLVEVVIFVVISILSWL